MKKMLIQDQKTQYQIVIPTLSTSTEQAAAEELQQYLRKSTGAVLPIVSETGTEGNAFFVGHTSYAQTNGIIGTSKENWIIRMINGNVILTGGIKATDRGVFYAVAHFLEDILGVRWWSATEEDVLSLAVLELDEDFAKEGTPAFAYRNIFSHRHYDDFYYKARNRENVVDDCLEGEVHHESVGRLGGALFMGRPGEVHTLNKYFPPAEYYDKHPDWYAWNDVEGRRIPYAHFCLNNEEFCEALFKRLSDYIEEDLAISEKTGVGIPDFYSISLPDESNGYCECEQCKQQRKNSGMSGYALNFVNKIARKVACKYPEVKIETLVYAEYLNPPLDGTLPEKNVIIRFAQVFADIIHGLHDRGNKTYLRQLKVWSEICKKADCKMYIWEYMYQIHCDTPFPIANRLGDTFRTFKDCGVSGIFVENQNSTANMWELTQYLLLHLCEDPYADTEALITDFIKRFYGAASEYVKSYMEELVRAATENDFSCYCVRESTHFNFIDLEVVKRGVPLLEKAALAVAEDPVKSFRVAWLQKILDFTLLIKYHDLKNLAKIRGESFSFDREALRKRIFDTLDKAVYYPHYKGGTARLETEKKFVSNLVFLEEEKAELPKDLEGIDPKNAYQFYFKNLCRHMFRPQVFGFSVVEDPKACLGKVARLCGAEATVPSISLRLQTTSRYAESKAPLSFSILQDEERIDGVELYKEDLVPDEYHLYKVGCASGIKDTGDTRLDLFDPPFEWVSIAGISVVFPMDACEIYLSMKVKGAMYGGSEEDIDALYLDRIIVVRQ